MNFHSHNLDKLVYIYISYDYLPSSQKHLFLELGHSSIAMFSKAFCWPSLSNQSFYRQIKLATRRVRVIIG